LNAVRATAISYEDVCPADCSSLLLPFSGLLEASFHRWIHTNHNIASGLLRKQLDEQCGLWVSLQALEYIYLGKDLSRSVTADRRVFELIDRKRQSWNDRFLLTELVQGAFTGVACVDTTRLIARSARTCSQDFENHWRSVKILKAISIEYVLPWPVANIITKEALLTYQRVSTFLMQIRRAKFVIERQRVLKFSDPHIHRDEKDDILGYCTRHSLLWFLNVIYSHITELVIEVSTTDMQKSLAKAKDVDAMIAVHQSYASSLEDQCLLSKNLVPIYQAVISLLDLSIHFSDIQVIRHGEHGVDEANRSRRTSTDQHYARNPTHRSRMNGEESGSDEEGQDTDDDTFEEGHTASISFLESPYSKRMADLKARFDQLCGFIVAGLRGIGRVDGQQSWEVLADKLEWKRERFIHAYKGDCLASNVMP
jgi:gamma-tubulin complex component 5